MLSKTPVLNKIEKLSQQMEKLKLEQNDLEKEMSNLILKVLKEKNAFTTDFSIVLGAIAHTIDTLPTTLPSHEEWKKRWT